MISAVVLSAGCSSRMGEPKALATLEGEPILRKVLHGIRSSSVAETIVVLGYEAERIRKGVTLDGARAIENPSWDAGMSSSLRFGVNALSASSEAFFVVLGDAPFVRHETYDALIGARKRSGARIAVPTFKGVRGNPVLLDRSLAPEVEALTGDRGCRALHMLHPQETVEVPVEDPGILIDIDTPAELARVRQALAERLPLDSIAAEFRREAALAPRDRSTLRPRVAGKPDILSLVGDLERRREAFALAIVVQTQAPTSGKPGFKALVRSNGTVIGWVGGSCSRRALVTEALAALADGEPRLLRLRAGGDADPPSASGVVDKVMEGQSGGSMEIYIEPHGAPPQLLIVGDSPVAESLASIGRLMGYRVIVAGLELDASRFPDADEIVSDLEQLPGKVDASTFAVVATMAQYDATALRSLAASKAAYVGLVASRRRAGLLFEQLRSEGIADGSVARIQNPAGVDISAKTPEEIALSIAAEITRIRRNPLASASP